MLRRVLLVTLMLSTIVAVGVAAAPSDNPLGRWHVGPLAHSPIGRMITGCIGRLMVLHSQMDVTAEQRTQIRDVLVSHRPQIAETAKSVQDKRVVLRDAVLSGADEAQIRAAAADLGKAIGDAAVKASKLRGQIAPILTEEQRAMVREFFKENDAAMDKFLEKAAAGK